MRSMGPRFSFKDSFLVRSVVDCCLAAIVSPNLQYFDMATMWTVTFVLFVIQGESQQ